MISLNILAELLCEWNFYGYVVQMKMVCFNAGTDVTRNHIGALRCCCIGHLYVTNSSIKSEYLIDSSNVTVTFKAVAFVNVRLRFNICASANAVKIRIAHFKGFFFWTNNKVSLLNATSKVNGEKRNFANNFPLKNKQKYKMVLKFLFHRWKVSGASIRSC